MRVVRTSVEHLDEWDRYVFAHQEATFFHRAGWFRVIHKSFGHVPYYFHVEDSSGKIVGVLPLFERKSFLFGHALVSVPFCVYGGALSDTAEADGLLEDAAIRTAQDLDVDYLELRTRVANGSDHHKVVTHATFARALPEDSEQLLGSIPKKQRAVVRKSLRNKLTVSRKNDTKAFFHAYSTSVRNLGTPVFARRYFDNLRTEFGSDCEVVAVESDGNLQCALMSFYFRDTVLPYYGGGLPESRSSKAMDFMYFDLMRRGIDSGFRRFDFGRSKVDSGPFHYKRHWGFSPEELEYQLCPVRARQVSQPSATNPKFQTLIEVWKKMPLRVSQWLGPGVSKHLG